MRLSRFSCYYRRVTVCACQKQSIRGFCPTDPGSESLDDILFAISRLNPTKLSLDSSVSDLDEFKYNDMAKFSTPMGPRPILSQYKSSPSFAQRVVYFAFPTRFFGKLLASVP